LLNVAGATKRDAGRDNLQSRDWYPCNIWQQILQHFDSATRQPARPMPQLTFFRPPGMSQRPKNAPICLKQIIIRGIFHGTRGENVPTAEAMPRNDPD
jgi:hypothetical protein